MQNELGWAEKEARGKCIHWNVINCKQNFDMFKSWTEEAKTNAWEKVITCHSNSNSQIKVNNAAYKYYKWSIFCIHTGEHLIKGPKNLSSVYRYFTLSLASLAASVIRLS